ncbi:MAG: ZrgA family zinc uptake protein, partial [Arenicella sp.]
EHKEHKDENTHSEYHVEYHFDCDASKGPLSIDASDLFTQFPNFSKIRVQWLSSSQQGSAVLSSTKNTVLIK